MSLAVPRYTVSDLESFPDDGNRYELLDGLLLVTPAPGISHQTVLARLVAELNGYLGGSGALVYTPGSVEIEPRVHLEPDILVVPTSGPIAKKWSEIRTWWLAVEISGPGSKIYDRDFKFAAYSALGVRDVWRVDLRDRCVVVKTGDAIARTHDEEFEWHPPELQPPLRIALQDLFDGIQGDS